MKHSSLDKPDGLTPSTQLGLFLYPYIGLFSVPQFPWPNEIYLGCTRAGMVCFLPWTMSQFCTFASAWRLNWITCASVRVDFDWSWSESESSKTPTIILYRINSSLREPYSQLLANLCRSWIYVSKVAPTVCNTGSLINSHTRNLVQQYHSCYQVYTCTSVIRHWMCTHS